MDDSIKYIGGRKFLLALLSYAGTFVLMMLDKIDSGVYATVVIAVVAAYITGNVVQKSTTAGQETKVSTTTEM